MGVKIKNTGADKVFDVANFLFWIVLLGVILYPLWLILVASVSEPDAVMLGKAFLWPVGFSWIGYEAVFQHKELLSSYAN